MIEVKTDHEAQRLAFLGSPTVLIDGVDLLSLAGRPPAEAPAPVGLSCRIYMRREGRISPLPDAADVHDALRAALTGREGGNQDGS